MMEEGLLHVFLQFHLVTQVIKIMVWEMFVFFKVHHVAVDTKTMEEEINAFLTLLLATLAIKMTVEEMFVYHRVPHVIRDTKTMEGAMFVL